MKKKYKLLFSFTIIIILFIYIKIINPYLQESKIKVHLKDKWDITIDSKDKLLTFVKNKPSWHRDQQKFILYESVNQNKLSNNTKKMDYNIVERIKEIEDILEIEKEDKVNFASDYYYKICINKKYTTASEQKNDLLYYITINENDKLRIFFIEDLNVLDLERSRF